MERYRDHWPAQPATEEAQAATTVRAPQTPLPQLIAAYRPITLQEMADVTLLRRTDTKYVLSTAVLHDVLQELRGAYSVLEVARARLHHYHTLYFDTPDFAMYRHHHTGAEDRYKVRSRAYLESNMAFFEVKYKDRKRRTIKQRLRTPQMVTTLAGEAGQFLDRRAPYAAADLRPALWNSFTRLTLVSNRRAERLTLDVNLAFYWDGRRVSLPGVAVAEVKQEAYSLDSDFITAVRTHGVRQTSFSKYCIGAGLLYPQLKRNHFKPQHLLLQKTMTGDYHVSTH